MKTLSQFLEAKMIATGDFKISASGRKVRRLIKIGDDDYDKEKDIDKDGDIDNNDRRLSKESVDESKVPERMQGKQKPYVSSDGKGNYEVLGNTGQTKATFTRADHGSMAHGKAQAHLRSKYDEYMKEDTQLEEGVNKSDVPAYLRKKTGDKLTTQDLEKERTQNRSHPETIKKINGTEMKEQAPIAPSIGVHRIGVTVSDSDHPVVTKRKELIQKFVRVTAHDKDRALEIGKKHFIKKGWKVHDASHSGMVHEETLDEYSMEDLHKDAAEHLKKSIDKQSDDRIAALKNPPKKKGFFARVGEKQINMVKGAYHGLTKEEVELEEAKDKTDKRFDLLARLGLVEKDELANLRLAMKTLSEDKQLSIKQRDLLLNVYESLISLVTGDDTMFSRMKIKVQEHMLHEKKDSDTGENVPFDGPYTKVPDSVKDKSGAEHTPQSRARHLARLAMKQMAKKSK